MPQFFVKAYIASEKLEVTEHSRHQLYLHVCLSLSFGLSVFLSNSISASLFLSVSVCLSLKVERG